jgi:zinc transporter
LIAAVRAFLYSNGKAAELAFADGAGQFGTADLVWLHLDGREVGAKPWLSAQSDIPQVVKSALLASETRPRCEFIGEGALVNLRSLGKTPEDDPDPLVSTRFWIERGRVTTLGMRSALAYETVRDHFLGGKITDPGDLITAYAVAISDELDPEIAQLGDDLDTIETHLEDGNLYATRRKVSNIRSTAIGYRRFVSPQRTALEKLVAGPLHCLDEEDRLHLSDATDRFARMAEELESVRERAAVVHEELTDLRAEKMDSRALVISIVAAVFLPLTFITGVFGMNFDHMPLIHDRHSYSWFWWTMGVCAIITVGGFVWFVRHKWINRDGSLD